MAKVATLREIDEHWSLCDVAEANDLLDLAEEAERKAIEQMRGDD